MLKKGKHVHRWGQKAYKIWFGDVKNAQSSALTRLKSVQLPYKRPEIAAKMPKLGQICINEAKTVMKRSFEDAGKCPNMLPRIPKWS